MCECLYDDSQEFFKEGAVHMYEEGAVLTKSRYPSPNPNISLSIVTYLSQGLRVKGFLAEPKDKKQYDGFLYLRGGIKNVGSVRPARICQFAQEGFIVFAPFYRGNQGGEGNEDFGGDDRHDAFSAFSLLKAHPNVKNIHIFGFSRGGVMALQTAIQFPEASSIVTWGGVSDMELTYSERVDLRRMMKRVIGGTPAKYPLRYRFRTPLYELDRLESPALIIHGCKDTNVSFEHAVRLEHRLMELHKPVTTWYFEEYTHYFPPAVNRKIVKELTNWMKMQSEK